jgi:hypothetical protein
MSTKCRQQKKYLYLAQNPPDQQATISLKVSTFRNKKNTGKYRSLAIDRCRVVNAEGRSREILWGWFLPPIILFADLTADLFYIDITL